VALDHDGNPVCRPGTDRTGRLIARCPPFRVGELTRFSAVVPNTGGETARSHGAPPMAPIRRRLRVFSTCLLLADLPLLGPNLLLAL
jgi:hypothetical protein